MGRIEWIKVNTNIFSNRKVMILLKERNGDSYFRIWIQLLTIAGECNRNGGLYINDNIPFTIKELGKIIGKTEQKLAQIIKELLNLEMLSFEDNTYFIKNWSKYQSADKMEEIREQNRKRQRKYQDSKKKNNNVIITLDNKREKSIEENKEKEGENRDGISKFQEFD